MKVEKDKRMTRARVSPEREELVNNLFVRVNEFAIEHDTVLIIEEPGPFGELKTDVLVKGGSNLAIEKANIAAFVLGACDFLRIHYREKNHGDPTALGIALRDFLKESGFKVKAPSIPDKVIAVFEND